MSLVHTPGPWRSFQSGVCTDAVVPPHRVHGYGCSNDFVCSLNDGEYHEYFDIVEQEANARLIAAAPDFLVSARSLLEAWDARTTGAQQIITGKSDRDLQRQAADAMEGLRAAIAKATGASS